MRIIRVYKIINNINCDVYIGSTLSELKCRWNCHKNQIKKSCSKDFIEKYGIENCHIILIKEYQGLDCIIETRKIQRVYEQLWLNKYNKFAVNEYNALYLKISNFQGCDRIRLHKYSLCSHNITRYQCEECINFFCDICSKKYSSKYYLKVHKCKLTRD